MGIFPFINPETVLQANAPVELALFQEYAYNFEENCLRLKDGKTYLVKGNEALQVWIFKALHTHRYAHAAYSRAYGSEVNTLFGQAIQSDILLPELQRLIVECLMVNPYIKELKNFEFEVSGAKVSVTYDCATIYGKLPQLRYFYSEERKM